MSINDESQYLERTPDLIAKIRTLREETQKQMDRFTSADGYNIRRVVGHGPDPEPVPASSKVATPPPGSKSVKSSAMPKQIAIEFGEGEST